MVPSDRPFRWRSVIAVVFLPTIVFSMGQYAIIPVIPALAQDLGSDLGAAALIASMLVVGQLLGDIPSGALVARIGERRAMIAATGLALVAVVAMLLAPHPAVLGLGVLLLGIAGASFGLARHAFMTSFVPLRSRARALATLGGSNRLGAVAGPLVGAALLAATGEPASVVVLLAVCCFAAATVLLVLRDPAAAVVRGPQTSGETEVRAEAVGLWATLAAQRNVLLTIGVGSAILSGLRQVRQVVLPVWAISIGLDEATTSLVIGVAAAIDFSLFFLGGWIMDRFGRLWTILPCAIGLSVGLIALAFTHDLDARVGWYIGIALFLALSNGLGAGILMTLGADLADRRNPAPFLGAWRFTTDLGGAGAPVLVTALTAAFSLSIGVGVLGGIGLVGAAILRYFVPRFVSSRPGHDASA
ncbi:MFS transporter [Pseudolysinimonas yzui]|uniref:MFS transporter n=1 Tax=Pseudolysinimonas yzui TaxID=2708254 RepID=A0A8J3DVL5_9MICO|nr:MFS transporter [Pseudolysinimonas yzui]GHF04497.1 MFS transporter [Pseudolysinimonas yzui]